MFEYLDFRMPHPLHISLLITALTSLCVGLAHADTPPERSSKEFVAVGPGGQAYQSSVAIVSDIYGPMVSFSINKPMEAPEPEVDEIRKFIAEELVRICAPYKGSPTRDHIISDQEDDIEVLRYQFKGQSRVAWSTSIHCKPNI